MATPSTSPCVILPSDQWRRVLPAQWERPFSRFALAPATYAGGHKRGESGRA